MLGLVFVGMWVMLAYRACWHVALWSVVCVLSVMVNLLGFYVGFHVCIYVWVLGVVHEGCMGVCIGVCICVWAC